ncbi:MAG: helix-turn-helix domain-containing protein, partial [Paraclostridium sp.]
MVNGSFKGLYTFLDVAEIYGIDDSSLRKQVARGKFILNEDVKKMGHTWIITEQAMVKSFGTLKFEDYKKKLEKKEKSQAKKLNAKKAKSKSTRSNNKVHSMNEKEEKIKDSWVVGEIEGVELESFSFGIN